MQRVIARTEHFYRTFGWWSVVIARFIPWGRVFVPVIAGVGRMGYARFVTANIVGALRVGRRHHRDRLLRRIHPRGEGAGLRDRRRLHHGIRHRGHQGVATGARRPRSVCTG